MCMMSIQLVNSGDVGTGIPSIVLMITQEASSPSPRKCHVEEVKLGE